MESTGLQKSERAQRNAEMNYYDTAGNWVPDSFLCPFCRCNDTAATHDYRCPLHPSRQVEQKGEKQ